MRSVAKLETKEMTEVKVNPEDSSSLKGTLYAVFGIGIFLVITWLIVFSIFLERN
ncbi:cytochrome c oxidase subunit 2A [Bacillus sp. Hm123]|uniref:cytochrome c oxidase subunit 2A n=1 Tax=Bacillus sp. Hm123 TaxID=3450745 RepID=UPI003F437734